MELKLTVRSKADQSTREAQCDLGKEVILGRTVESPIPLDGTGVSREHLVFKHNGSSLLVQDRSSNWTSINGARIAKEQFHPLTAGDAIEIPGYEIWFQVLGEEPKPAAAVATASDTGRVEVPLSVEAPPKKSALAPVTEFLGSFSGLEKFVIFVDLIAIALFIAYRGL
jgi:predicted component of type VI protein secretion system